MGRQGSFLKRCTDILISVVVLIITAPVMIICMAAIVLESEGPAVFVQERVGVSGKLFKLYKLRGMVNNAVAIGGNITRQNDPRLTRTGKLFRRLSIDEIPQFYNVLKGDMSIVGPRPEVPEYTLDFSPEEREVFNFKPGITGYSQVNGRQGLTARQRAALEVTYYSRAGFFSDLRIVLKTPLVVITNEGNT